MKTYVFAALAALMLTAASSPCAKAAIIRRSMLIRACTSHDQQLLNNCAGYITGIADLADDTRQGVCIPPGLKVGLMRQGVTNWLQSHVTSDGPAVPSVLDALRNLYRCKT